MPRKMTEEEANARDIKLGAIPIGPYKGSHTKRQYKCTMCGKYYMARPHHVKSCNKIQCNSCAKSILRIENSQIRANLKDKAVGAIPIGPYEGIGIEREYTCITCGKSYTARPNRVRWEGKLRCNDCVRKTWTKEEEQLLLDNSPYRDEEQLLKMFPGRSISALKSRYYKIKVDGDSRILLINRGRCKSLNEAKDVLKELNMDIEEDSYTSFYDKCTVICSCGRRFKTTIKSIKHGGTSSCGHCNDPNIGDVFGMLTIIDVIPSLKSGCRVKAQCECGRIIGPLPANRISRTNGQGKISCGNCKLFCNGIPTSYKAQDLKKVVEEIVGHFCEHNHKIGKKYFDIVDLENRIAIEYDEHHWHRVKRDTTKKEKADTRLAIKHGFKILRIRAHRDLPTKEQLKKVINNHFEHGAKQHTITTPGWKNASIK